MDNSVVTPGDRRYKGIHGDGKKYCKNKEIFKKKKLC